MCSGARFEAADPLCKKDCLVFPLTLPYNESSQHGCCPCLTTCFVLCDLYCAARQCWQIGYVSMHALRNCLCSCCFVLAAGLYALYPYTGCFLVRRALYLPVCPVTRHEVSMEVSICAACSLLWDLSLWDHALWGFVLWSAGLLSAGLYCILSWRHAFRAK